MELVSREFYWDVGNRIREFRQDRRYSVEELSEKAGISTKYLYRIENGRVRFSTEILYRLASALGVPADSILMQDRKDVGSFVLAEVTGKFTEDEKEYIRGMIVKDLVH